MIASLRLRLGLFALAAGASALAADAPYPWPKDPPPFQPVTAERVAALPAGQRAAWVAYVERSVAFAKKLPAKRAAFVTPDLTRLEGPGIPSKYSRGLNVNGPVESYTTDQAKALAARVVEDQSAAGGWTKGNDYTKPHVAKTGEPDVWSSGTFDNDSTITEMRFLARVISANPDRPATAAARESFLRGVNYILAAQYPNGGFPQIYPLAGGYHDAITFNDDAMEHVLEFLREIGEGKTVYAFVPADLRTKALAAVAAGIKCVLAAQLKSASGQLEVWCQQHDPITLKPCAARNFEPPALCTNESGSLAKYLMTIPQPSPEVVAAVKGAIGWLESKALHDIAWSRAGGVGQLVARPGAAPLWARMYEIGSEKPIFGDRDRTVHFDVNELSSERRNGYAWYGNWPASALTAYKDWSAKNK